MKANIIMEVQEFTNEGIYPGESIFFTVSREDESEYPTTGTMDVEIYDNLGKKIDTLEVSLEADNLLFKVLYLDTANWTRKKTYNLWARYKDSATNYNNVLVDLELKVK